MNDIKYKRNCTTVYDSYKLSDKQINNIAIKIVFERTQKKLKLTRNWISYAAEIKAHKRAYKLGIMRSHTKDADLEEPISKIKDILYKIVGL